MFMQLESSLHGRICCYATRGSGRWGGGRGWEGGGRKQELCIRISLREFWHHLSSILAGPEACLERGQGQALSCKSCCAQCLFKVGHVEHISVTLASPSSPPLDLCCGRSSCPGSRGSRLLWSMACGRASLVEETRQTKSSPDAVSLTWQGSLPPQADGSKICETQLFPGVSAVSTKATREREEGVPERRSPQSPNELGK